MEQYGAVAPLRTRSVTLSIFAVAAMCASSCGGSGPTQNSDSIPVGDHLTVKCPSAQDVGRALMRNETAPVASQIEAAGSANTTGTQCAYTDESGKTVTVRVTPTTVAQYNSLEQNSETTGVKLEKVRGLGEAAFEVNATEVVVLSDDDLIVVSAASSTLPQTEAVARLFL
jgi:hypothetical protein